MFDEYEFDVPDWYLRQDHTVGENLQRADQYVRDVLSQEEYYGVIPPCGVVEAQRPENQRRLRQDKPLRRTYHFSDRTNRPEPSSSPS